MLIKLQKQLKMEDTTYKAGDVVDLEEMQASILIKKGLAVKQEDKNHKKDNPTEKQNIFIKLYGTDAIQMGTLRSKVFNAFISTMSKRYIVKSNPDGYLTTCLTCGGNLFVNNFTGTTYCFNCKQEQPFEYLFEILKGCDIYSIVQEIQNQQPKRKAMRW